MLSNYHWANLLEAENELRRRGKDENNKREMSQKPVPCPELMTTYCDTFHLIDKGNEAEAKYDMAGKSRSHNWAPKIVLHMSMNNVYIVYKELAAKDGGTCLTIGRALKELAHGLCQR
jgi:hypothetical protein